MVYIVKNFPQTQNKIHTTLITEIADRLHNTYNHLRYIENSKSIQVHKVKKNKQKKSRHFLINTITEIHWQKCSYCSRLVGLFSVKVALSFALRLHYCQAKRFTFGMF